MPHTPGPWSFMTDTTGQFLAVYAKPQGGTKVICPVKIADEADAHLITASPELLTVAEGAWHLCESLLSYRHGATDDLIREVSSRLQDAIAKAKGRR